MGVLEQASRKRTRRRNFQNIILGAVAVVGILAIGMLAPNVLGAMKKLGISLSDRDSEVIKRSQRTLVEKGLLKYEQGFLRLTKKGERWLRTHEQDSWRFKKSSQWDRKWRILVFDIPEKRKSLRDKVRRTLRTIGFVRLQDSVWVYPYDCEDLIALLKADFHIGKNLLYLIVEGLEYDRQFREHFKLA